MKRLLAHLSIVASAIALAGCAASSGGSGGDSTGAQSCTPATMHTHTAGKLTVGTDSPAYPPWFKGNDPTNGKGYESAVAYAVADQLADAKCKLLV